MTTDKNKIYKNDSPKKAYHRAWYRKNRDKILENNRIKRELNETNKISIKEKNVKEKDEDKEYEDKVILKKSKVKKKKKINNINITKNNNVYNNSNLDDSNKSFESESSLLTSEDSNSSFDTESSLLISEDSKSNFDSCPIFNEDYLLINEIFNYDSNFS
tara:strand:+ start:41 stop:520 length:480 start_codon:yes stop_codon:yes gene_type:complete